MQTVWNNGRIDYEKPKVMGILNVTPDSFSDGGQHMSDAVEYGIWMAENGADIIDIGGYSTRPGYTEISEDEESSRIVEVIREISGTVDVPISVDTMSAVVAYKALDAGADIINDVNGLRGAGMIDMVASSGAPAIIGHMNSPAETVHDSTMTGDIMSQVSDFLLNRVEVLCDMGVPREKMIIDPGIGFGKTDEQNLLIIENLEIMASDIPILIGASRKRFLKTAFPGMDREEASVAVAVMAIKNGASIVRVHDVPRTVRAISEQFDGGRNGH